MSALVADRGDKPTFERGHDDPEPLLCPPYGLGKAVGARGAWNTAARTHDARLLHHLLDIGVCKLPDEAHIGGEIPRAWPDRADTVRGVEDPFEVLKTPAALDHADEQEFAIGVHRPDIGLFDIGRPVETPVPGRHVGAETSSASPEETSTARSGNASR